MLIPAWQQAIYEIQALGPQGIKDLLRAPQGTIVLVIAGSILSNSIRINLFIDLRPILSESGSLIPIVLVTLKHSLP